MAKKRLILIAALLLIGACGNSGATGTTGTSGDTSVPQPAPVAPQPGAVMIQVDDGNGFQVMCVEDSDPGSSLNEQALALSCNWDAYNAQVNPGFFLPTGG